MTNNKANHKLDPHYQKAKKVILDMYKKYRKGKDTNLYLAAT